MFKINSHKRPSEDTDGLFFFGQKRYCLYGEGWATTASCLCIRIADDELRTLQAFSVVDFRTNQILVAHRVNQERQAVFLDFKIVVVFDFIKGKTILEAGATATVDEYAQFQIGIVLFGYQVGNFGAAAVSKDNRASSDMMWFLLYEYFYYCRANR